MDDVIPHTAMILAAGLGTRMRPLSLSRPKPLIEVGGRALIDHMLDKMAAISVRNAIVNVHYLPDQIEAHLRGRSAPRIIISDERSQLLETGGALVHARHALGRDPFFLCNTDQIWIDGQNPVARALARAFKPREMDILLLLARSEHSLGYSGAGDFFRDETGRLTRRADAASAPFVYAGMAIMRPQILDGFQDAPFSANLLFDKALTKRRLFGFVMEPFWMHVGDPDALAATNDWLQGARGE